MRKNDKVDENRIVKNRYSNRPIDYIFSLHTHTNIQFLKGWKEL